MYTEDRKSLGKLRILLESNREYYCIFRQAAHASGTYICIEQTKTALGQHLLDLLESSKDMIGRIAEQYRGIDDYLTRDYMVFEKIQSYLLFIQKLYQELADTNIIWKSVLSNSPVFFHYHWYQFYSTREYLQDCAPVGETARQEHMRHHWDLTRRSILEEITLFDTIASFITSMGNAVAFCLDDSTFPEQKEMHPIKRSYLYQSLFDNHFMSNDSMKVALHLSERNPFPPGKTLTTNTETITPKKQLYQSTFSTKNYFNLFQNADSKTTYQRYLTDIDSQETELALTLDIETLEDVYTACMYSFFTLVSKGIHVRRCKRCGRYFSPYNRSDEIYCSKIWENGKRCRELYQEERLQSDDLTRYYRAAYKVQNAKKQRNLRNKPSSEKTFREWNQRAKAALEQAKNNEISFEEFKRIVDAKSESRT